MSQRTARRRLLELLGPFLGLLVVWAIFSALEPRAFTSARNLRTIASQTVVVALGAIGMTYVIVSAGIDLSVGSVMALTCVVTAWFLREGAGTWLAVVAAMLAGAACGAINGLVIVGLRVVPFIATLGMMGIARGVAEWIGDQTTINAPPEAAATVQDLVAITGESSLPAWVPTAPAVWLTLALAALAAFVLRRTVFGVHTFALGSSEDAARLCGVPVARTKVWIYTVGGLFAGLAGVMLFGRIGQGDPSAAMGKELDVIAAVVIGGASLSGGSGSILGSMIGALLMTSLATGCDLAGVPNFVQKVLVGAIIVAAVALDQLRHPRVG